MNCKNCDPPAWYKINDLVLEEVIGDIGVKEGDTWRIFAKIRSDTWVTERTGKLCIYEENNIVASSSDFTLKARESINIVLSGKMPNRDLYLNASLISEDLFNLVDCEDGQTVFIPLSDVTDHYDPDEKPEDKNIEEWIRDNLVLILMLILAIIIIAKFG